MPCTHVMCLATTRCNLRCAHCVRGHPDEQFDLSPDVWKKVLAQSKRLGFRSAGFTGGEPALHPQFDLLVEMAVAKGFQISIATNGIQPAPYLRIFEEYGRNVFTFIKVSLDGTKDAHERIRGEGSFDKTIAAVERFQQAGMAVVVAFCLTKTNVDGLEDFLVLCNDRGVKHVEIGGLIRTADNAAIAPSMADFDKARGVIARMQDRFNTCYHKNTLELEQWVSSPVIGFCSELGDPTLTVDARGRAFFCCSTMEEISVAASLERSSVAEAYGKTLDLGRHILARRIRDIDEDDIRLGFNSCDYCNRVLGERVAETKRAPASLDVADDCEGPEPLAAPTRTPRPKRRPARKRAATTKSGADG